MRHVRITVAVAVACVVVSLAIWKSGVLRTPGVGPDPSERETARVINLGQTAFKRVHLVPQPKGMASLDRGERVQALATIEGEVPKSTEQVRALFLKFAEFEQLRYGGASADEYSRWRVANGYRLRPLAVMKKEWMVDSNFELYFGEKFPENPEHSAVFTRFYDFGLKAHNGSSDPVDVADEPRGIVVCFGNMTNGRLSSRPMSEGAFGSQAWYGRVSATMRSWWEPVRSADIVAKENGTLLRAELGVLTKFGDGRLCPRTYSFYWDPATSRWMLESINDNNADFSHTTPLEY